MSILIASLAIARLTSQTVPPAPRIRIVPQHSGGLIQDIEESLDGTRLITHDKGYAPRLWDAKHQILLRVLDSHPDIVDLANFSSDGKWVLTRSPKEVRVWDSTRAKCVSTFPVPTGDATSAVVSSDGTKVAVGTRGGAVTLFSAGQKRALTASGKAVTTLGFDPEGTRLVAGGLDGAGRMWNLKAGGPPLALSGHKGALRWVDFASASKLVLITSQDGTASLWTSAGKRVATYPHVIGDRMIGNVQMGALFVGRGDSEIAACDAKGTIHLYKTGAAKSSRSLSGHRDSIREIRKSRDGRYLATYANDLTLRMWDVSLGKQIPFDPGTGNPTAGDFSPNRNVFWLGYSHGEVRQFDIKTGKATRETFGSVDQVISARLVPGTSTLFWRGESDGSGGFTEGSSQHVFLDVTGNSPAHDYRLFVDDESLSPDGNYLVVNSRISDDAFVLVDLRRSMALDRSKTRMRCAWSPDSTRLAAMDGDKGSVTIIETKTGTILKVWDLPLDKTWGGIEGPVWHPNGKWLMTAHHPGNKIMIWDPESGKEIHTFGNFKQLYGDAGFLDEGRLLVVKGWSDMQVYEVETGKLLWEKTRKDYGDISQFQLNQATGQIAFTTDTHTIILDARTGKETLRLPGFGAYAWTADGKHLLAADEKVATWWDLSTKRPVLSVRHAGKVVSCGIGPGDRLLTADDVEGFHVWDGKGHRLATMVAMKDGTWLAYDDEGRYDATDPSRVTGAFFILEWQQGLEPLAMTQLKSQFYEPHLLAKALGLDTEPKRDVPSLESLRLFPALTVKAESDTQFSIEAKERDDGGIGAIRVSVNGKEVLRKKGTGFFTLHIQPYSSFLLPEARLKPGEKNTLTVTVSNASGELTSPPETLEIAVPPDLKAPDVKLYALTVGIGDYAGTSGDLVAPPSDARAISQALGEVAEKLLPRKTEITRLTTSGDDRRPTRSNILAWLKDVGKRATSSDIVFIFVAGHGTNKVGDRTGYYLLTSEADPGDMTAASARTSAISGEELRQALAGIPAGKQVVILDTCHSGAASASLLHASDRSVSGDYQRAWEAIKDTTGTWLLAGAAADQVSYESANVDHGILTYALLEAVDHASPEGLRKTPTGEYFVDVERWLSYAANRVESLKNEVGIRGIQHPEFKRAAKGETFDIGVMDEKRKGFLDLRPPLPIVIVGNFEQDQEDPLNLEEAIAGSMRDSKTVKPWFDVAKHPGVYRVAGEYRLVGDDVRLKLFLQIFDDRQQRSNLESIEISGSKANLPELAVRVRQEIETRIKTREKAKTEKSQPNRQTQERTSCS